MATAIAIALTEVDLLRQNAQVTAEILRKNVAGITHEESMRQPQPAGNCLNWVVGHLVFVYDQILPMVGQQPVFAKDELARYGRGTAPLVSSDEAKDLGELMKAWDEACTRYDAGLAALTPEHLDAKSGVSPRNNPNETVRSLLGLVSFHQAYHTGQAGILRRMAGRERAVA
ncbi:MAG TPA: DinB family protein [Terriglobales bacterium]|nr:DinB family protein [Terriglobales bacterium]